MIYARTNRITLRERVFAMGLPDIPAVMARIGADYQQPMRSFPSAQDMLVELGLDLGGVTSSPELTRRYVAAFCKTNHLK